MTMEYGKLRPIPQRFGFLIEAEPGDNNKKGLRQGKITWAWNTNMLKSDILPDYVPNVSAVNTYFNLDRDDYSLDYLKRFPLRITNVWRDNPVQHGAVFDIWRTCRHVMAEEGDALIRYSSDRTALSLQLTEDLFFSDVIGEYIMVWACLILLTTRQTVNYRTVDTAVLNKARSKKGKPLLLDHQTVHINLSGNNVGRHHRPLGFTRKSPRIHMVSSYPYLRRSGEYGIVLPYIRGSGTTMPARKIKVHG